jgi:hypothetical protein
MAHPLRTNRQERRDLKHATENEQTEERRRTLRLALAAIVVAYGASVSGQKLSTEAVPDGRYALRSVANPENRLAESDPDSDGAIVYLQIDGDEVEEIDEK